MAEKVSWLKHLASQCLHRMRQVPTMPKFEYRTVWGIDRRAQGPLELRREKSGLIEWRYDGSEWSSKSIPDNVAQLFETRNV